MHSNFFLTNKSGDETINLVNKQEANLFLVANKNTNLLKNINVILKNNNKLNIYCLILSNGSGKTVNINVKHLGSDSVSNIYVKALANNNAIVKINCFSSCKAKTHKNVVNQNIDGLMFDNNSLIEALPCLDININDVVAKHVVNIGQVDPEIIFYLNSKGLNKTQAYQFLIDSFLKELNPFLIYKKINISQEIASLIGGKYE